MILPDVHKARIDMRNLGIRLSQPFVLMTVWFAWIMLFYTVVLSIIGLSIFFYDTIILGVLPHFHWTHALRNRLEGLFVLAVILSVIFSLNPKWRKVSSK